MRKHSVLAALIFAAVLAVPISAAKAVTLGMADDPVLLRSGGDARAALLDAGQSRHVGVVRVIASVDRDREGYLSLARTLRDRGMTMLATLDIPFGAARGHQSPDYFAPWAAGMAADLAATGVDLRVSLLNEPDLRLPAAGLCAPDAVDRIVNSSRPVTTATTSRLRVRVRRTRVIRYVLHRHGHRVVVRRRVPMTHRVRVRQRSHGYRWVTRPAYRWTFRRVTTTGEGRVDSYSVVTDLTPRRQCFAIIRARHAAEYLRAAIPAVRAAAPGVPVEIGETSPDPSASTFIGELATQGLPPVDGWADHPYGLLQAEATANLVRRYFGPIPLDWTEFGSDGGPAFAALLWRQAGGLAKRLGVRDLVAYQWQTEPGARWDTSLLGPGLTETERSKEFESIAG